MRKFIRILFALLVIGVGVLAIIYGGSEVLKQNWYGLVFVIYGVGSSVVAVSFLRGAKVSDFFESLSDLFRF